MTEVRPRVAVVGAGAWGTTLALLLARASRSTPLAHSAATADRICTTHRNEPRLPGIDLPTTLSRPLTSALSTAADLVVSPSRPRIFGPRWSASRRLSRRRPTSSR